MSAYYYPAPTPPSFIPQTQFIPPMQLGPQPPVNHLVTNNQTGQFPPSNQMGQFPPSIPSGQFPQMHQAGIQQQPVQNLVPNNQTGQVQNSNQAGQFSAKNPLGKGQNNGRGKGNGRNGPKGPYHPTGRHARSISPRRANNQGIIKALHRIGDKLDQMVVHMAGIGKIAKNIQKLEEGMQFAPAPTGQSNPKAVDDQKVQEEKAPEE